MVYETFLQTIKTQLSNRLGDGYHLTLQKVPKNNGLTLDGLAICPDGRTIAPMIYLNYYYELFSEGVSMDTLVDEIMSVYTENAGVLHVDFSILNDFERLKDKIVFQLVNTCANQSALEDMPSIPCQDLSIVFYLLLERTPYGNITSTVYNRHVKMWDTTTEELYALAEKNTPRLLPQQLRSMTEVMDDIAREHMGTHCHPGIMDELMPEQESIPLYALSNTNGINGACAILYPKVLKNFAEKLGKDLVILPSSIHEVLLTPYSDDLSFDSLTDMVTSINQSEVAVEDRLSNHVYFYSRLADEFFLAQSPASKYAS